MNSNELPFSNQRGDYLVRPLGALEGVFVTKKDTRPRLKSLSLTTQLTSRLRQRAREEGTTVHGALSSAFALAFW